MPQDPPPREGKAHWNQLPTLPQGLSRYGIHSIVSVTCSKMLCRPMLENCIEMMMPFLLVLQMMGVSDFADMVASFMRVTWAAAAGKLHLASSVQPPNATSSLSISASSFTFVSNRRCHSTGSTGSGTSSGSDADNHCLHSGVCIRQTQVCPRDSNIAREALELLVTCLQLRSSLIGQSFSSLLFTSLLSMRE